MPEPTPLARLSALIAESGLSQQAFAGLVLGRDSRSLRRYLAGEPIPETLAAWLARVERVDVQPDRVRIVVTT